MKTVWKAVIALIAAGLLLSLLAILMGASRWVYWDKSGPHIVSSSAAERITELDLGRFTNIDINADFADIEFIKSDKYGIDISSYDSDVSWHLDGGNLNINFNLQNRIRFFDINLSFSYPKNYIKVYLPAAVELGAVSAKTHSGNMKIGDFRADDVRLHNSFGDLDTYSIACNKLQIDLSSGDFTGKNLSVSGHIKYKSDFGSSKFETVNAKSFVLRSDSGDVTVHGCNVESIEIKNSFGQITARNLVSSQTDIDASSGEINVSGEFSGQTVINNDFGNVKFSTSRTREEYTYDISTDFGNITFDNNRVRSRTIGGSASENNLRITNSSGDIQVYFAK